MRRVLIGVFVLCPLVLAAAAGGQQIDQPQLERVMASTVFIKVDRLYRNEPVPTAGSGFFVSSAGHVVTNRHVVAPQIQIELYGRATEISTTLGKIQVVVGSGTSNERTLVAKIVALDRKHDLALLATNADTSVWLPSPNGVDLAVTDPVWAVGYPFGDLLALNKSNPEVTVTSGHVTALRHGDEGELEAVQVDAAVNPGNSGGPLIDSRGRVVGVSWAGVSGGSGTALAVSSNHLESFLAANQTRVRFEPDGVYVRSDPIRVRIESRLLDVRGLRCTLSLSGDDIDEVTKEIEWKGGLFDDYFALPPGRADVEPAGAYSVALRLQDAAGRAVWQRRYKLRVKSGAAATVDSSRDPAAMMRDRGLVGNRADSSDVREIDVGAGGETVTRTPLSELGKSIKLRKSDPDGAVSVSNSTLGAIGFVPVEANYSDIPEALRSTAIEYDEIEFHLRDLTHAVNEARTTQRSYEARAAAEGKYSNQGQAAMRQARASMAWARSRGMNATSMKVRLQTLAGELVGFGVCRCADGTWHLKQSNPPCGACLVLPPG